MTVKRSRGLWLIFVAGLCVAVSGCDAHDQADATRAVSDVNVSASVSDVHVIMKRKLAEVVWSAPTGVPAPTTYSIYVDTADPVNVPGDRTAYALPAALLKPGQHVYVQVAAVRGDATSIPVGTDFQVPFAATGAPTKVSNRPAQPGSVPRSALATITGGKSPSGGQGAHAATRTTRTLSTSEAFLRELSKGGLSDQNSDSEWIRLGKAICSVYDQGASTSAVYYAVESQGLSQAQATVLIGAALNNYCPENWPRATTSAGSTSSYAGGGSTESDPQFNIGPIDGDTSSEVRCKDPDTGEIDICTTPSK